MFFRVIWTGIFIDLLLVKDYLLFIDTEATDLPKNWSQPFDSAGNWPHALQISWVIYDNKRKEVKREDHYIRIADDIIISDGALKVHGITHAYLQQHGEDIGKVLQLLLANFAQYDPLVIGHFIKLDYHVLAVELHRAGINYNFDDMPLFCTMIASTYMTLNTAHRQLRLDELYNFLFYKELTNHHNALYDALSAADCFFELMDRGDVTAKVIDQQNKSSYKWRQPQVKQKGWFLPLILLVIVGIALIYCFL